MIDLRRRLVAFGRGVRSIGPERRHLKADLLAGLPVAIGGVPDGMAAGVLARSREPEAARALIRFLASPAAGFTTGAALGVDGGTVRAIG